MSVGDPQIRAAASQTHGPSTCPGCLGTSIRRLRRIDDFLLAQCRTCDLVFVLPRPTAEQLAGYYARYFREASADEVVMHANRTPLHEAGLRRIQQQVPGGLLVDVGAAWGDFMELAHAAGYDVSGVEVAPEPCARVVAAGMPCFCGSLPEAPLAAGSASVITFWDTLEHLSELRETLVAARRILRPGGLLVATVPNRRFQMALIGAERLLQRDGSGRLEVPSHLNHFSARALRSSLEVTGFDVLSVEPAQPTPVARRRTLRAKRVVYAAALGAHRVRLNIGNSLLVRATPSVGEH